MTSTSEDTKYPYAPYGYLVSSDDASSKDTVQPCCNQHAARDLIEGLVVMSLVPGGDLIVQHSLRSGFPAVGPGVVVPGKIAGSYGFTLFPAQTGQPTGCRGLVLL